MTATLIGSFALGDALPGLKDALEETGVALTTLKGVVDGAISTLSDLEAALDELASSVDSVKDDLIAGPVSEVQNAIDAAQTLLDDLDAITDPSLYLDGVIAQINDAIVSLEGLVPADYLADLIAGTNAGIDAQQLRLDANLAMVSDLTDIYDDVATYTAALGALESVLQDASDASIGGIVAYTEQMSELLNAGVYVVSYNGTLSALGSDVDGVLPGTGLGGSENVSGPLLIVQTSNTATLTALNNVFGL